MDGTEIDIATYLTIDGQVFIAPQFDIKWEMNEGGSCPDFVALDFSCKEIVIVEVTTAADWKPLAKRVHDREKQWFAPARRWLEQSNVTDETWHIRFLESVREVHHVMDGFSRTRRRSMSRIIASRRYAVARRVVFS